MGNEPGYQFSKPLLWCALALLTVGTPGITSANPDDTGLLSGSGQPQAIQLNDGTKLTFLGLTYGKHHAAPHYENLASGNWIYTPDGTTVAWIEANHDPSRWPNFELLVSNKANTGCVSTERRTSSHVKNGLDVLGFVLNAFPRWDKEMILRVRPFGGATANGQFVIPIVEHGSLSNWTPESMPNTKSDGDFDVTLTNLVAGVPLPYRRGDHAPEDDSANRCVRIAFGFQQNGRPVTNWSPGLVQTSDPAGNRVQSVISAYPQDGIYVYPRPGDPEIARTDGYFYRPGLWPDEAAWKVRLEFTRTSGFNEDEILNFTNLLVRAGTQQDADDEWTWDGSKTNFTFTPAFIEGVQVKLLAPLLYAPRILPGEKHLCVIIYADPNPTLQGMHLTVLEATDDQGRPVWSPFSPAWAGHFSLDFPNPRDTKTLSLKLALHKSRFVEFTVKPAKW